MSQQYSLRWNNHQPNFISMFTTLLNTQTLVDVTLAAEGRHLQAHKVVLSACSTYFQSLFVDNPSRHPIVILKDVTFADLRTMVDFMYYGEVNVTEEQLPKVLDTAKLLKIKGLTEMPDSTSLTRSQATSAEYQSQGDSVDSQRHSGSPAMSPNNKKKRRRKSSSGSTSVNMVGEDHARHEDSAQTIDLVRETITLSSLPQQRRSIDPTHQITEQPHLPGMEPMMDATAALQGQWMEHAYPRYTSACLVAAGAGALQDPAMYMGGVGAGAGGGGASAGGVMDNHLEYGGGMPSAGPSPGPSCVEAPHQDAAPVRRRRTTNPQAEENFQRALEAVRFGGIGFCKAARMFGVNNRTLWLEYKKRGYPNNRPSIKNRIKREQPTPPPKQEIVHEQHMALLCPPPPVPVGFIDSRAGVGAGVGVGVAMEFPQQGVPHGSPSSLNILGQNYNNSMQ